MISFNHKIQKKNQFIAQIKYVQSEVVGVPRCRCHPRCRHPTVHHRHLPTAAPFCIPCWGWRGGGVLCDVLALWCGGGVLRAGWATREVGGGAALSSVLGWRHGGACAWRVGVVAGLACHVGMASRWGLHVGSRRRGWILRAVTVAVVADLHMAKTEAARLVCGEAEAAAGTCEA